MRLEIMQSATTPSKKRNSLLALSLLCASNLAFADKDCLETINEAQKEAVEVATIYAELHGQLGIGETCKANPSKSECNRIDTQINILERKLGHSLNQYERLNRKVRQECKK